MFTFLFSTLFLGLGLVFGWLGAERYMAYMTFERHDFEELFTENPHPEIYDAKGNINRGDYMYVNFDLGYDADEFDPEDIYEE